MKFNRLESFQKNPVQIKKYRIALSLLYELGVDHLLLELAVTSFPTTEGPNALTMNALENQRMLGFRECVEKLFSLDPDAAQQEIPLKPDYGAIDKLIDEGFLTSEEAEEFAKGQM